MTNDHDSRSDAYDKLIGLGERSFKKSYYPELRKRLDDLERFRNLLDQAYDFIFLVERPSGAIVFANQAARVSLGGQGADAGQLRLADILPPAAAEEIERLLQQPDLLASGPTVTCHLQTEQGQTIPVELRAGLSESRGDSFAVIVARDVTERLRAEASLLRHMQELVALNKLSRRLASTRSIEEVASASLEEIVAAADPEAALFYVRRGDLLVPISKHLRDPGLEVFFHQPLSMGECLCGQAAQMQMALFSNDLVADPRCVRKYCSDAGMVSGAALPLHSGETVTGVLFLGGKRQDQNFESQRNFLETLANETAAGLQTALLLDELRAHSDLLAETNQNLLRQIAERENAEADTRRLRDLLGAIIDSMPSALIVLDAKDRVVLWNEGAKRLLNIDPQTAEGAPLEQVMPTLSWDVAGLGASMLAANPITNERITWDMGDVTRIFDITLYPLQVKDLRGAVMRLDDVTERCRMEEMVIQSEKMLTVGGLAAGMAHEINNPLAAIIGSVQVMSQRLTASSKRNLAAADEVGVTMEAIHAYMKKRGILEMLAAIKESGLRAARIVENMLSFSRKSESKRQPTDMADLLDRTLELAASDYDLKKQYDFRDIEIVREYTPGAPLAPCERSKIQQVLFNLISNGAQAMASWTPPDLRKPRFIFRLAPDLGMLRIEVEDNGPGMDETVRKRAFEPFFTTKAVGEGTGLGLSVSYFIITQNHGGAMSVESTPGKGARFIIRLPIV